MPTNTESIVRTQDLAQGHRRRVYSPATIIHKLHEGEHISDDEVLYGVTFFKELSGKLFRCGPIFALAAKEANHNYDTLWSCAVARGIHSR